MTISAKNIAKLNARNRMTDEERRADIMAETFGPLFGSIFGGIDKPKCPGCRERLDGSLICCNPDAAAAHNKLRECNCSLRTKLVGDGCSVCNPEYAARFTQDDTHGRDDETRS